MHYTTEKIEKTRAHVAQTEQRIARQRRRVEKLLVERHPADEAQAQLLIMEQSLIAMTRFLKNLERDLEVGDLSLQRIQTGKRIKAVQNRPEALSAEPETAEPTVAPGGAAPERKRHPPRSTEASGNNS